MPHALIFQEEAAKLKAKFERAKERSVAFMAPRSTPHQELRNTSAGKQRLDREVTLMQTGRNGMSVPLTSAAALQSKRDLDNKFAAGGSKRKVQQSSLYPLTSFQADTHDKEGKRARYFADDDKHDLNDLVQRERLGLEDHPEEVFMRLSAKSAHKTDDRLDGYTLDDMFVDKAGKKVDKKKTEERDKQKAIAGAVGLDSDLMSNTRTEFHRTNAVLENCSLCFDGPKFQKHLVVSLGVKVVLTLTLMRM